MIPYDINNEGIPNSFLYGGVEYDYDGYECDNDNCGCKDGTDYCRCATYTGLKIKDINLKDICGVLLRKSSKRKDVINTEDSQFINYCVDRLVRIYKMYDKDNWEINTCGGYYGDEISNIEFTNGFGNLIDDIKKLLSLTPSQRIEFILEKEYGYLLPELENRNWNMKDISITELKKVMSNENYRKKVDGELYKDHDLPIGIYIKNGDKLRLIDGYHRLVGNLDGNKSVEIIVGE